MDVQTNSPPKLHQQQISVILPLATDSAIAPRHGTHVATAAAPPVQAEAMAHPPQVPISAPNVETIWARHSGLWVPHGAHAVTGFVPNTAVQAQSATSVETCWSEDFCTGTVVEWVLELTG